MHEHLEQLALEIIDPIKKANENIERNCYLGYVGYGKQFMGIYWRSPAWKRLSKDKGIGSILLRIYNHPHEKRHDLLKAVNLTDTCGDLVQILLKCEMISWTRKTHYEITPLGIAMLKKFNLI